jgi:L-threonylcarbamoyladenylate synthase
LFRKQKKSIPFSKVDPVCPEPGIISAAADIIRHGGVVVFPTRDLYGLAADAFNPKAVDRIFKIKKRPTSKPLLTLIKNKNELHKLVRKVPPVAEYLMANFWPGNLTIILDAIDTLPNNLTSGTGKIGIRLPKHPVAMSLVSALENPITGTSANISGKSGCSNASDLHASIIRKVDCILNAGELEKGIGSTVVEVTEAGVEVLREGSVSAEKIFSVLNKPS